MVILINNGANLNAEDLEGNTCLHWAAIKGFEGPTALILTMKEVKINCRNKIGATPLIMASMEGLTKLMEILLDGGADPNIPDNEFFTPLCHAVLPCDMSGLRLLLQRGADVNASNLSDTETPCHVHKPIHIAAKLGKLDAMNLLIAFGANVNQYLNLNKFQEVTKGKNFLKTLELGPLVGLETLKSRIQSSSVCTPLHLAASAGHTEAVKLLLQKGAKVNFDHFQNHPMSPLLSALAWPKVMGMLFKASPGTSKDYLALLLFQCALRGYHETSELILKMGIDVNVADKNVRTALHLASHKGFANVVTKLVQMGANVNLTDNHGFTPLHYACVKGNFKAAKSLIKSSNIPVEIDKKAKNAIGDTPLMRACQRGDLDMVQLLLENGADIFVGDDLDGSNSLHTCLTSSSQESALVLMTKSSQGGSKEGYEIVKKLVEVNQAIVNTRNKKDYTPLYQAVVTGWDKVVQFLIAQGANVPDDVDAISSAVVHTRSVRIAATLLDHGADPNVKVDMRHHPRLIQAALENGDVEMVKLLLKTGADILLCDDLSRNALHSSIQSGQVKLVEIVLNNFKAIKENANFAKLGGYNDAEKLFVNLPDEAGWTPLHYAASDGHADIAQMILSRGANSKVADKIGMTPHMVAAIGGFAEVARILDDSEETNVAQDTNRILSDLAKQQCCFNDIVEAKAFMSQCWTKDGFININQDLLGMKLEPCCTISSRQSSVGISRICIEEISIVKCRAHCKQQSECSKTNALLDACQKIQKFLSSSDSKLRPLHPTMHLAGSMAEGTRLGGADEIDVTLTFEELNKHPFALCEDEDSIALSVPDGLEQLETATDSRGSFSYSKFINMLCKDLWFCMQKLDRENLLLDGLSCNAYWEPCQECRLADAVNRISLKHCESCLPAVTYSKSGPCLIFTWTDEYLSKGTLTMDLIPSFELTYFGNFASLSQRVFKSLYKTRPEGWDDYFSQLSRRDRLLMDWRSKSEMLEQEHKQRTETTALKLINDYDGDGHYVIRPRQKLDSHALASNAPLKKLYIIIKALVKVLELEASTFLIKKHLLSFYRQSPEIIDECSGTPAREILLFHRIPQVLLRLEIKNIFQEKIDLVSWVRSIQASKDAYVAIRYLVLRNPNPSIISDVKYSHKIAEGMLKDHEFESFLYKDDYFYNSPESIKEEDVVASANYFMQRSPKMLSNALSGLYASYKKNGGFSDNDPIWNLCLNTLECHRTNSQLQIKALKILTCLAIGRSPDESILQRLQAAVSPADGTSKLVSYAGLLCTQLSLRYIKRW